MKVAVIGSRGLHVDVSAYIPPEATEIITGGARGIDTQAERYANERGLKLTVFRPAYDILGPRAPLARNEQIVSAADMVVAIWDGRSRGTRHAISRAMQQNKPLQIHVIDEKSTI
jgi:predicted Rossmann fold nucleotide-binding protein DprA/Smf involved in DNA uptake